MNKKGKKSAGFWLCISLIICLISCIGASMIQTNFGKVTVKDLRFETESGHQMSALLLKPDTATAENPAPAIICSHGWYNNREMQDLNYVEYARRGYVVLQLICMGTAIQITCLQETGGNQKIMQMECMMLLK